MAWLLLGLAAAPPSDAQILQNGSFETVSGSSSPDTYNGHFVYSGASSWTTTGKVVFTGAEGTSDGLQAAIFNTFNEPAGNTLSQTFSTVVGTSYEVRFDFGAYGGPGVQRLAASASGLSLLGGVDAIADGPANSANFTPYGFAFTADSPSTTLTFNDAGSVTTDVDGVLDNVRVSSVPEPSGVAAFAFTGLGAAGLIFQAGRRRTQSRRPG